jgi:hypothetical protein
VFKLNILGSSNEVPFQPSFFAKPPFRSYFFIGQTLLLAMALSILGLVLASYWPRLSAINIYWLGLVGFCMVTVWILALRCYRRIHELFEGGAVGSVSDDSPLGVAMSSAAGMIFWGLFFGYMMTIGVLMQLANVLSSH